ncbi:MAG: clostripain-related cysteine peptidase [Thermoplasmata archaeon]
MRRVLALALILALLAGLSANQDAEALGTKWTILVYMAADNNLEDMSALDFGEMAQVGSTEDVKIVVQYDRKVGGYSTNPDWTSTKRFLIQQGDAPLPGNEIDDIGEASMDDPATLIDFTTWGMSGFPADHYFLILWDHGLSWQGLVKDDSNSSYLTTPELGLALEQIVASNGGRRLDMVGFDTCRTTLEIMYEIKDYVDFIVGSEKDEDARGWAYDDFLQPLVDDPSMTPFELSREVVDAFIEEYEGVSAYSAILSSVNASRIGSVVSTLDDLLQDLYYFIPYYGEEIRAAWNATEKYEVDERDLYDLADELIRYMDNVRIGRKAENLKSQVLLAVAYERHWDNEQDLKGVRLVDAHGISLSYPTTQVIATYSDLAFSKDTLWDEYLDYYRTSGKMVSSLEVTGSNQDSNGDLLNDTMTVTLTSEIDGLVEYEVYRFNDLVKEDSFAIAAGIPESLVYSPSIPGYYNYFFFLFNDTGYLRNYTTIMSSDMSRDPILYVNALCVESMITVQGVVRDEKGNNLEGATVIMRNNETSEVLEATANESGYSFEITFPKWMQAGDSIDLNASHGGRIGGVSFRVPDSPLDLSYDIIIDLSTTGSGQLDILTLVLIFLILVIAVLASVVLTAYIVGRKGQESTVEDEPAPPANACGVCGAEINLGAFSEECINCGSLFHSACIKGRKRCPLCRKLLT